jgi:phage terminase large subunit
VKDLTTIRRNVAELRATVGATERKPIAFRAIEADGSTSVLDLDGNEAEGEGILFSVPAKAIAPILAGSRHTVLHGGRAGGKSHTVARYLVALAYATPVRILCVREVMLSIRDSVHSLLRDIIDSVPAIADTFEILESEIRGANGSLFTFRGMRKESAHSVKGFESYDVAWIEEASALSRRSIDLLIPTIRKPGSRLIWSMNPENEDDPAYVDFLSETAIHVEDATIERVLFSDNPFVSEETIADAELDRRTDDSKFRHVWGGGLREKGKGQIFPNFEVVEDIDLDDINTSSQVDHVRYGPGFRTHWERKHGKGSIFAGLDIGHAESATHCVLGWHSPDRGEILILDEYRGLGKSPNEIARELDAKIPLLKGKRITLHTDAAATGMIRHLQDCGFRVDAANKWPGSVLAGIDRLQSQKIKICDRCSGTIEDFRLYSWQTDANETAIGEPEKKHDHAPDALRYALWRWIKSGSSGEYRRLVDPYE